MNGRAVCDSHHINEDVLYATYHAAVEAMIEDAGALLEVIQTETEVEMQPRNKAAMDEVEQQIIELQERVLDLRQLLSVFGLHCQLCTFSHSLDYLIGILCHLSKCSRICAFHDIFSYMM